MKIILAILVLLAIEINSASDTTIEAVLEDKRTNSYKSHETTDLGIEADQITKTEEKTSTPNHTNMFTKDEEEILEGIAYEMVCVEKKIGSSLKKTKRTPAGYTEVEVIMEYGRAGDNALITESIRKDLSNLLKAQLERRGMTQLQIKHVEFGERDKKLVDLPAAVAILKGWVRGLGILANADQAIRSLDYIQSKYSESQGNIRLLHSLYNLQQMHTNYSKFSKETAGAKILENMHPLLRQSLMHLEEHLGMCGVGAEGRAFLIELGMLNFFKDSHPYLEVAA